jgi:MFS family permease
MTSARWRMLAILSLAELLGMSLWFTASAVAPQLAARWDLGAADTALLTGAVQLGFVAGTAAAAILNVADLVPNRLLFTVSAVLASGANASLVVANGFPAALASRLFTGVFLAGVYPPAMKMIATWFRDGRGLAIGTLVGALTIGKATPWLVRALGNAGVETVVLVASAGALASAALVAATYRDGPFPFTRRPFSWSLVRTVVAHRPTRLAIGGYLGHMWELYAMWTWLPAFVAASETARRLGRGAAPDAMVVDLIAFAGIAAGGVGCVWGGWVADRIGRARLVSLSMAASGACCLLVGFSFGASLWVLVPLALIWGFFVVSDSAQFSAMVTEVAPDYAVGTALTLQTSTGFLLTMATIQLVPVMAEAVGWAWAFPILAVGPAAGIAAIARMANAE